MARSSHSLQVGVAYDWSGSLIDSTAAIEAAQQGLDLIRLEDNPGVAAARAESHAGEPILVWRLDAPGQGYYLIPWQSKQGVVIVVQVDAQSGVMSSAATLAGPVQRLMLASEEAQRAVSDQLGIHATGEPRLVWQACHETASPFQPLYQVPIEGGHVFVSVDGQVYRRLTPFMKGG